MGVKIKPKASTIHHPHLIVLHRDTSEVLRAAKSLFASLSPEQLSWKPDRKTWSVIECFDHLLTTNGLYMPRIQQAIEKSRVPGAKSLLPYKPSWFATKFIASMRPGSGFRVRTFKIFKPRASEPDADVTQRFILQQQALLNLMRAADQCDLNGTKLSSPASRMIRFTIGEALTLLVVHQQRHLLQAQNLQLQVHFPSFQS